MMTNNLLFPNQPAPDIRMEAVESGRVVVPARPDARYLVLLFQSQKTARALADVQDTVRARFPQADDVRIVSVVDLRSAPRMFSGMAKSALKRAYDSAGEHLPTGWQPADYVVILPDWKGDFFQAFGVTDADDEATAVVINIDGVIIASRQGATLGQFVLEAIMAAEQTNGG